MLLQKLLRTTDSQESRMLSLVYLFKALKRTNMYCILIFLVLFQEIYIRVIISLIQ
jgi:hypothetical protein